jgi:hypothetical protein
MGRGRKQEGTAVIFLETDLEMAQPFDENSLSPVQKQCFWWLSSDNQERVRAGYGTIIADLESQTKVCTFNMESYNPPKDALYSFARALLPLAKEFFSVDENRRAFEKHMEKEDK